MKKFLPYLIPVLSIVFIAAFLVYTDNPGVTGFAVLNNEYEIDSSVKLKINANEVIPGDALMLVSLDDKEAGITVKDFIVKAGGEVQDEYKGGVVYSLTLKDFNLDNKLPKGEHILKTRLVYKGETISESENIIII
ncbi:MAG: hypothetical protein HYS32_01850 [Candidatus Woesearchaeota archaeon]|nr:MAG: hypothetical protein HYS32_01850 [Candidatus Woesearchaeota archaeon]